MNYRSDPFNRRNTPEEQRLYDHLLSCVRTETPDRLTERFKALFIDGGGYPDAEIAAAIDRLVNSKEAQEEFQYILNRCCHILINRWQTNSQHQKAIPQLVNLFEGSSLKFSQPYYQSRRGARLQELVKEFSNSEHYLTLQRLARVVDDSENEVEENEKRPLGNYIRRYPYLYSHCLLSDRSSYEHQQTVRKIQAQQQRQFELHLSQYVTYQVRRAQLARHSGLDKARRILKPIANPTLLSDRELYHSLKQFVGKAECGYTYRDLAHSFITHSSEVQSYGEFKAELYDYLITTTHCDYGKRLFNERLSKQLKGTLPQSDGQKVSDFLIVRTCSQLLNFLVVESIQRPNHFVFIDLISNIGPIATTGLLLKIVLLCRKVKPYLEKKFSILFNHYENSTDDAIQWLIKMLENLNVALSTNFGAVDLSFISQIA